jgi:hypothetical protein
MKTSLLAAAVALTTLAASTGAVPAFQSTFGQPVDKAFAKGGAIRMSLAAGDYKIAGSPDDKIRIEWRADRAEQASTLKADAEVKGATAVISTSGFKNGIHFTISVPARSDIDIGLSAGDLDVRGIEGNKRIESWAGDVTIDVGQPDLYKSVEASVRAGDLNARPFNVSKGGLFRSFSWAGKGSYTLLAKLVAGDLTLR